MWHYVNSLLPYHSNKILLLLVSLDLLVSLLSSLGSQVSPDFTTSTIGSKGLTSFTRLTHLFNSSQEIVKKYLSFASCSYWPYLGFELALGRFLSSHNLYSTPLVLADTSEHEALNSVVLNASQAKWLLPKQRSAHHHWHQSKEEEEYKNSNVFWVQAFLQVWKCLQKCWSFFSSFQYCILLSDYFCTLLL